MGPLAAIARVNAGAALSKEGIAAPQDDAGKIGRAANQFEALLIGQILKSAHSGSEGWMGAGDDDESSSTAIQMAEEYLGQALANGGGLGIAKLVTDGFNKKSIPASSGSLPTNSLPSHTGLTRESK